MNSPAPELSIYRDHCIALLRRYCAMSIDVGRLPALLGREIFDVRAQTYHCCSFEDTVIFVHDVERCLDCLQPLDKQLIARIILQDYTQEEAAKLLHVHRQTVIRRLPEALDCLTEMFLQRRLLDITHRVRPARLPQDDLSRNGAIDDDIAPTTDPAAEGRDSLPLGAIPRSPAAERRYSLAHRGSGGTGSENASEPQRGGTRSELEPNVSSVVPQIFAQAELVNTPFVSLSPQSHESNAEINHLAMRHLPPPICYAGYVR
ncbi:MAG: hypothetical protein ACR2IF_00655 [Terriglobales bacterium]